tara:strand:+ start:811 stop:1068 length:258 start_codon:yes stop_codon:yes gene_type:complete
MNSKDIKLGLRVSVLPNNNVENSIPRTALVVGTPEYYTPRAKLVRIKYENSTRYEYKLNHQMEPLPIEQQYPHHGGTHVKPEGDF